MKSLIRRLLASLIVCCAVLPAARAADADVAYIVSYIETAPAAAANAAATARAFGKASRQEPGNLRFEVLQRIGQLNHFAILEAWKDKEAHAAHAVSARTKEFRDKLEALLRSPYDERPHVALSVGPVQAGPVGAGAVYVVTHVDVVPPSKDVAIGMIKQLSEASRADKGNARFEGLTQISRPNHSTVVEIWQSHAALDEHGVAAHTKEFRTKLAPLSGSLYDERLYKILD